MTKMSHAEALVTAILDSMAADADVVLLGRPLGLGPQRMLMSRLTDRFEDRVYDPPVCEAGNAALGVGAAMAGIRPFVDLSTGSFSFLAFSQIINEAAVSNYMTAGKIPVPVTFHCLEGVRGGGAPQHSQNIHAFVWNTAGLEILAPSCPADMYGLTRAALASNNPTFIMNHAKLMAVEGDVPDDRAAIPIGKADIKRRGKDVTIVALSLMVGLALQAAEELAKEGIDVEVVDPRTLAPLDEETILASVARTGRLVVVDETNMQGSIASGIAGMVAERGFRSLKAAVQRVARPDTPVPFSAPMEAFLLPTHETIMAAVKRTLV
ncbi:MAG: alpha-ketoacid dehydrogenase subunit beta [Hyphomicrobiales bacterium]|nr:alpha-ketoacid dehydrogenase subunit beta [Hyphomicrobiales bacterium]